MAHKDNTIDITNLKNANLTVGNLKDIVRVLEYSTAILLLPDEVTAALDRLHKVIADADGTS
jgi:ABC-type iron transport system FetAB ATPase subunit